MIFTDKLHNYFISTYDALGDYCRVEKLVEDDINDKEQFWLDDYVNPELVKAKQNVSIVFEKEYKALCKSKEYFYLCPIAIFKYTYRSCLSSSSVDEVTFISNKLQTLLNDDSPGSFLNPLNKSILEENRKKQLEYLGIILTQKFRMSYTFENNEFKLVKLNIDQLELELDNFPDLFTEREYYLNFLELASDYKDGKIQDNTPISFWSYIKETLLKYQMIHKKPRKEFVFLLKDHELLSDESYEYLVDQNFKLRSLAKSETESRLMVVKNYFL